MKQSWNAYINEQLVVEPTASGRLSGKTFAVKDVYAIAGYASGAGNPDWLRTHGPSDAHAAVIQRLLGSGARLEGTTITDEIMYSINGENAHYGTPINPKAAGRIPGGSSSGSAVAVSAGLVDFALGTDTGGSVRVPSAYCGIYGIRPTHGAVDVDGLIPLAPSFDTVGWMANDAQTLLDVGYVLLEEQPKHAAPFSRILFATDLWELPDEPSKEGLSYLLPMLRKLAAQQEEVVLAPEGLRGWMDAFRCIQGIEIWEEHGEWIKRENPSFGPGIAERFQWVSGLKREDNAEAFVKREGIREKMDSLLSDDAVLIIPTVPAIASLLERSGAEVEQRRMLTMEMSCVAGLSGLPQITVPVTGEGGCPIGLSFIGGRHQDIRLLEWVAHIVDKEILEWSRKGSGQQ